jgi:aarF domain-containing kinase
LNFVVCDCGSLFTPIYPTTGSAVLGAIDYKRTFAGKYDSEYEELEAFSQCHTRSAQRVMRALLANGGACSRLPFHGV